MRTSRKWTVLACVVVALLLVGAGTVVLIRTLTEDDPPVGESPVARYGFAHDSGAPWAPTSGRLDVADQGGDRTVRIGLRFDSRAALDALGGGPLEFRLTVRSDCKAGSWLAPDHDADVDGVPGAYAKVTTGGCGQTVVRLGARDPDKLKPGRDYTLTARLPAGAARSTGMTLAVSDGRDSHNLVGDGWAFDGRGCRRWFNTATSSFPCLPASGARLMTLGDSVTAGFDNEHTWRYRVWEKLVHNGAPEWLGSAPHNYPYAVPAGSWGSETDAEGGITATTVAGRVGPLLEAEKPDIILIDLGTNDVHPLNHLTPAQTADSLEQIVETAQTINPHVQVLLGQPAGHINVAPALMADIATRIDGIVTRRTTSDSLVTAVDLRSGWNRTIYTWDGTHPSVVGEYLIAKRYVDILATRYAYGRRFGPLPAPRVPPTPRNVRGLASAGAVLITWTDLPQVHEFRVYLRDATINERFQLVFAGRQASWGRKGIPAGHKYEFYVTAVSSNLESSPSPVATMVGVQ